LIEGLVLLEQDVFGLKIAMDDVVLMAVVDAGQNLLDQKGGIAFSELTAGDNLVEEFSTFADFLNQVVTFIVLKELVHLDDVGVIKLLKNVDLVEEHALLVFVHVGFTQDLDGTLGTSGSVDAHANFTEGTVSEDLSDTVVISEFAFVLLNDVLDTDCVFRLDHFVS
jgi:hypothetical protein